MTSCWQTYLRLLALLSDFDILKRILWPEYHPMKSHREKIYLDLNFFLPVQPLRKSDLKSRVRDHLVYQRDSIQVDHKKLFEIQPAGEIFQNIRNIHVSIQAHHEEAAQGLCPVWIFLSRLSKQNKNVLFFCNMKMSSLFKE